MQFRPGADQVEPDQWLRRKVSMRSVNFVSCLNTCKYNLDILRNEAA